MLGFFGRGSAFADTHNNAFFTDGSELVLIDCSMLSFGSITRLCEKNSFSRIYIIVTRTHGDHVSGIGMLIHYAYYALHIPVTVAVPCAEVGRDIEYMCGRLDGCSAEAYEIVHAGTLGWVKDVIPTKHSPSLDGRCFGYHLDVCGQDTVYTGDTCTLEPFLPFVTPQTALFTEIASVYSPVHLYIGSALGTLIALSESGTKVYLMHIDDENAVSGAISGTKIQLAPVATIAL